MDPQDERPATQHRGRKMARRGSRGVTGQRSDDHYTPPNLPHHRPLLSHLTAQCLMIINTLKHLRSAGSERAPERGRDERRGGRERGEREGMVMMCLRMICRIDITNHLIPMVTPLGCTHSHTHSHTSTNTGYTFTPKERYQPNKYFSFAFDFLFQRHGAYLKRLLVCVCTLHVI